MSRFQRSDANTPGCDQLGTHTVDLKEEMPRKKRSKSKKKSKKMSEDLSVIMENVEVHSSIGERQAERQAERQTERHTHHGRPGESQRADHNSPAKQKTSKDVYFAFLPDKYEPLIEDEVEEDAEWKEKKERRNLKKKEKYKKYRKNIGKALRFGWRCLVAGLQSFAGGYATPLSAAATLVTDIHQVNNKG